MLKYITAILVFFSIEGAIASFSVVILKEHEHQRMTYHPSEIQDEIKSELQKHYLKINEQPYFIVGPNPQENRSIALRTFFLLKYPNADLFIQTHDFCLVFVDKKIITLLGKNLVEKLGDQYNPIVQEKGLDRFNQSVNVVNSSIRSIDLKNSDSYNKIINMAKIINELPARKYDGCIATMCYEHIDLYCQRNETKIVQRYRYDFKSYISIENKNGRRDFCLLELYKKEELPRLITDFFYKIHKHILDPEYNKFPEAEDFKAIEIRANIIKQRYNKPETQPVSSC